MSQICIVAAVLAGLLSTGGCTARKDSRWRECGLHASYSGNQVGVLGDIGKPYSETVKFPESINYPVSVQLGRIAATVWTDAEFLNFVNQLPRELRGLNLNGDFPLERLSMIREAVKRIGFVDVSPDTNSEAMTNFVDYYRDSINTELSNETAGASGRTKRQHE